MKKTEIIERIEEIYNKAESNGDVYYSDMLHGLLIDCGAVEPEYKYPKCRRIDNYEVLNQWLIIGYKIKAVCLELSINNGQKAYLTCETLGGAVVLWYENPTDDYEDRMSLIWNLTDQKRGIGYITEPAGAFDQWIFPVETLTDDEGIGQTDAENELYQFIATLADMFGF